MTRTLLLGALGLVLAVATGLGVHLLTRETIALPVVRLEQGAALAPATAARPATVRARTTVPRTTVPRTTVPRTTTRPATAARGTTATTNDDSARTEDGSGSGSGSGSSGRGRGRGRGGDQSDD